MSKTSLAGSWGSSIPSFLRKHPLISIVTVQVFPPPAVDKCSLFPISSPAWAVFRFIDLSHSDWYNTKFQSSFDLHFPGDEGW